MHTIFVSLMLADDGWLAAGWTALFSGAHFRTIAQAVVAYLQRSVMVRQMKLTRRTSQQELRAYG